MYILEFFTTNIYSSIITAIDAGVVVMTDIPSSIPNSSHNVVIVGYQQGGDLIYMDPENGCLQTESESSFSKNYLIYITGVK